MATRRRKMTVREVAQKYGFRSGLEKTICDELTDAGVEYQYEQSKLEYEKPATKHKYTPDIQLNNGIYIEVKGRFLPEDRRKHLLVRESNPEVDIRFCFQNSRTKIGPKSPTSYGDWCRKHGFLFSDKSIPEDWIKEKPKK